MRAVTAEQVLALARDTFRAENRTVVTSVAAPAVDLKATTAGEGRTAR